MEVNLWPTCPLPGKRAIRTDVGLNLNHGQTEWMSIGWFVIFKNLKEEVAGSPKSESLYGGDQSHRKPWIRRLPPKNWPGAPKEHILPVASGKQTQGWAIFKAPNLGNQGNLEFCTKKGHVPKSWVVVGPHKWRAFLINWERCEFWVRRFIGLQVLLWPGLAIKTKDFFSAWHFRENFVNSLFPRPFFSGVGYLVRASHFPQGRVSEMAAQLPVEQNSHQFFCQGRRVVWWDWVTTDPSVLVPVLSVPASTSRTSRSRPLLNPPNQSCDSELWF